MGETTSYNAWLLIQHADLDVSFQAECLALMKAAPLGEVDVATMAYLEDRVLVNKGEAQLYGTQLNIINGLYVAKPYKDGNEDAVNVKRAEVGLPPLADYITDVTKLNPLHLDKTNTT